MDRLLTSPSLRRELGARAYDAYTRNWTAETHVQRYLELVDEVASSKGTG
jgi:glycosyltransferase involved in cell wall biosynthesis